uniref:Protein-lysine N-methyltransferase TR117296 n=1 Tax=Schistocephalus solidus TaxID=70667 RepID=A0A0V0JCE0_SCHSO
MGDFEPSELGTKAHWDSHYERELQNFDEVGDIGDIWFGQQSEKRVLKYLSDIGIPPNSRILDVGSGNGHLTIELGKRGFKHVVGIDYSENAIALSKKLLTEETTLANCVDFKCVDILSTDSVTSSLFSGKEEDLFDVVIDKGTFDAISLTRAESPTPADLAASGEEAVGSQRAASKRPRQLYLAHIYRLMRPSGHFIITSCNWTADELKGEFEQPLSEDLSSEFAGNAPLHPLFSFCQKLPPLRTFTFGGMTGADTVCLVFKLAQ